MDLENYKTVSTTAKDLECTTQWVYVLIKKKTLTSQLIDTITFVVFDKNYEDYKKFKIWQST